MSYTTLVDAATLKARLDDRGWLVIDCRHQLADPGGGEQPAELLEIWLVGPRGDQEGRLA